jgi:hypothetical protein
MAQAVLEATEVFTELFEGPERSAPGVAVRALGREMSRRTVRSEPRWAGLKPIGGTFFTRSHHSLRGGGL